MLNSKQEKELKDVVLIISFLGSVVWLGSGVYKVLMLSNTLVTFFSKDEIFLLMVAIMLIMFLLLLRINSFKSLFYEDNVNYSLLSQGIPREEE